MHGDVDYDCTPYPEVLDFAGPNVEGQAYAEHRWTWGADSGRRWARCLRCDVTIRFVLEPGDVVNQQTLTAFYGEQMARRTLPPVRPEPLTARGSLVNSARVLHTSRGDVCPLPIGNSGTQPSGSGACTHRHAYLVLCEYDATCSDCGATLPRWWADR